MRVGSFEIETVDQCLDILEAAFQSDLWKHVDNQEGKRLLEKLAHILDVSARTI